MPDIKVYARFPFTYNGEDLDRGQITKLAGAANDEKLLRLGYLQKLTKDDPVSNCGKCQKQFRGDEFRDGHGKLRHSGREVDDEAIEDEQRRAMNQTPLRLDQTIASKNAGV